jgi:hypothetical protein
MNDSVTTDGAENKKISVEICMIDKYFAYTSTVVDILVLTFDSKKTNETSLLSSVLQRHFFPSGSTS